MDCDCSLPCVSITKHTHTPHPHPRQVVSYYLLCWATLFFCLAWIITQPLTSYCVNYFACSIQSPLSHILEYLVLRWWDSLGRIGGTVLLEKVRPWLQAWGFQKPTPFPVSSPCLLPVDHNINSQLQFRGHCCMPAMLPATTVKD